MSRLSTRALGYVIALALLGIAQPSVAAGHSCVTIDRVTVRIDGLVRASGHECVFEHYVTVRVRGADRRVLGQQTEIGRDGRWSAQLLVASPKDQRGTFEAFSRSPKNGAVVGLTRRGVRLPFTSPTAQRLVYRTRTDVDGDGRADLVTLRRTSRDAGIIDVTLASGAHTAIATRSFAAGRPALLRVGNVDGRAGNELFVELEHVSTADTIGIYTFSSGALRLAGTLPSSGHPGLFSGITCGMVRGRPSVTLHGFVLRPTMGPPRYWQQTDTRYVWQGTRLAPAHAGTARRLSGTPPPGLVGVQCGHPPA